METILQQDSNVKSYQTTIGGSSSQQALRSVILGGGGSNSAAITVTLQDTADLDATTTELRNKITTPDILGKFFIEVQSFSASNSQFQVTLNSNDQQALDDAAQTSVRGGAARGKHGQPQQRRLGGCADRVYHR